jgi:exosortase/archaeosortase family protein
MVSAPGSFVVGAMSALPAVPWRWRLFGLGASAIAISILNVVRIAVLCYLQAAQPSWFRPVHEQIAPMLVVLVASLCFVGWMRGLDYAHQS